MLNVMEIFKSFSGEVCSFHQGRRCTFIRLAGCNLKCDYCDTKESQKAKGTPFQAVEIFNQVNDLNSKYVIITGGEPLLQMEPLRDLVLLLLNNKFQVNIETNGTFIIPDWTMPGNYGWVKDKKPTWIVDYKFQYADQMTKSFYSLSDKDWIKFVIKTENDLLRAVIIQKDIEFARKIDVIKGCRNFAYSLLSTKDGGQVPASQVLSYFKNHSVDAVLNVQIHKMINMP